MKHLYVVPNPAAHLHMLITSPQGSFTRLDFRDLLIKLGRQGVKAVLLPGRWRIGKTVALPHEAVAAREEAASGRLHIHSPEEWL
ncbi:g11419 [Coccomyxa elongata]